MAVEYFEYQDMLLLTTSLHKELSFYKIMDDLMKSKLFLICLLWAGEAKTTTNVLISPYDVIMYLFFKLSSKWKV